MIWKALPRFETAFDPFGEFSQLQREFDRFFSGHGRSDFPAVNVWADEEKAVVTAELPGVDPKGLELTVSGNLLTLKGERPANELAEKESYLRRERSDGRFSRTVRLPFALEADQVEARVVNGVLTITLPRQEATKPRRVKIRTK